jgi:hypothetical protein
VKAENEMGEAGRFAPGLPAKGDGQMLFMLNGVAKLKEEGRMAIIQNGCVSIAENLPPLTLFLLVGIIHLS